MPDDTTIIETLKQKGWTIMSAYCDKTGLYDLSFHRWDNGKTTKTYAKKTWHEAITQCNNQIQNNEPTP